MLETTFFDVANNDFFQAPHVFFFLFLEVYPEHLELLVGFCIRNVFV